MSFFVSFCQCMLLYRNRIKSNALVENGAQEKFDIAETTSYTLS